ncbi:MAG TPA: DivIVA domain-containing protein [bacterium]|nr:DivIVA domain-containing protein [bacterium]
MRITPLDIQQKQYKRVFRGLDAEEVAQFLELVRTEFEELVKENNALKDEMRRKQSDIEEYREREKTLKDTMMTAQKISEDIKVNAKKDAELVISEAQLQADKIIQGAHARLVSVVEEINELKRQRTAYESGLSALLESHRKLLEVTVEASAEQAKRDERVQFLTKKKKAAGGGDAKSGDEPIYE